MGTFNDGDSGSSIRTKINTAIHTSAISTIDVDGGAIDGVTLGTNSAVTEAQVDNININGNTISSTDTNGDVTIDPNGTGDVNIGNFKFDADQTIGAGQDNYVLTYDNTGGKISLEAASGGGVGGATGVDFNDNVYARFGTGNDLQIYHDGASSYIDDVGTGSVAIRSNGFGVNIMTTVGTFMGQFSTSGAVTLYHNGATKFATSASGATVTGTMSVNNIGPVSGNLSVSNMTYNEVQYASLGTTGTLTPDPANGSVQKITLTGNITINALGGTPAAGDSVTLIIVQPASGSNYIDVLTIYYDGTNYLANLATNFS
jgi:hypothetical protein